MLGFLAAGSAEVNTEDVKGEQTWLLRSTGLSP